MDAEKILILGNYWQTLTAIRSLGRAGFPVVFGRSRDEGRVFTQYSRYTSEIWLHPESWSDPLPGIVRFAELGRSAVRHFMRGAAAPNRGRA